MGEPVEALKNHGRQQAFHARFAREHHMQPLVNLPVTLPSNFWLKTFGLKDIFWVWLQRFFFFYVVPQEHNTQKFLHSILLHHRKKAVYLWSGMENSW